MEITSSLPADGIAQSIVRHFQTEGFSGISEALIIRIGLKKGDRHAVDAAFDEAATQEQTPPVNEHFEIHPFGHFADSRSFAAAKSAIHVDFAESFRMEIPRVFFDAAPVVVDDAFATGTKYDAMLKLSDNINGYAFAILLNDPDSSFIEYLGTHHGNDWQKIMGSFEATATSYVPELDLL